MVGGASRASGPTPAAKLNPYPRSRRTLSAFARARLLHYHHVHPAPARHHYPILAARLGGARETLLVDLYATFEAAGWPEAIPSVTIVERLIAMESRPWPEWKRGKPITVRQLASLLRPFDVLQKEGLGRWDGWKPRITGERDGGCAVVVATARHNHRGRGVPESARWGMTPTTCTCPGARRSAQNRRYADTSSAAHHLQVSNRMRYCPGYAVLTTLYTTFSASHDRSGARTERGRNRRERVS